MILYTFGDGKMDKFKVHVVILDKRNWLDASALYNVNTRLAEVRNWRHIVKDRFEVDPDHVYEHYIQKRALIFFKKTIRERAVFIDNATRKSVTVKEAIKIKTGIFSTETKEAEPKSIEVSTSTTLHTDEEIDQKKRNMLDFLIERAFWLSILAKRKLALSTILILIFAGVGLYHFGLVILRALGVNV